MTLALAACGDRTSAPADAPEEPEQGAQTEEVSDPGPQSPVEGRTVALIPRSAEDPFYTAAADGARRYAAQWGLELRCPEEPVATAAAQADAILRAVEERVDGICISAIDAEVVHNALREARDAGVCVTTWDTDAAPDERSLMVSQGTAAVMGSMLTEMGAASLRERGVDPAGEIRWMMLDADGENAAWANAADEYIRQNYPGWINAAKPEDDADDADGAPVDMADVDLILCCSADSLVAECAAAHSFGLTAENVTITGFCTPSLMKEYLDAGVCARWGLWDCGLQSAMGCYLAAWLSAGNEVHVGDVVNIPRIGSVEILANSELAEGAETADANNGVVLLPERIVFTAGNIGDYSF